MEDYKILNSPNFTSLTKEVNEHRLLGYTLVGQPFTFTHGPEDVSICQAVAITQAPIQTVEQFMTPEPVKKPSLADEFGDMKPKPKKNGFAVGLGHKFKSGKKAGQYLEDVIRDDPGYVRWLKDNTGFQIDGEASEFLSEN